jgi:hypothetical protein
MYQTLSLLSLTALFALFACNTKKYATPDEFPKQQLVFGSGGGFTGKVQTYTLLENGQLFHHNGINDATQEMERLQKAEAQKLFKLAKDEELLGKTFNEPGNMYYFLKVKNNGKEETSFVWGSNSKTPPAKCDSLYANLMGFVKVRMSKAPKQQGEANE